MSGGGPAPEWDTPCFDEAEPTHLTYTPPPAEEPR